MSGIVRLIPIQETNPLFGSYTIGSRDYSLLFQALTHLEAHSLMYHWGMIINPNYETHSEGCG